MFLPPPATETDFIGYSVQNQEVSGIGNTPIIIERTYSGELAVAICLLVLESCLIKDDVLKRKTSNFKNPACSIINKITIQCYSPKREVTECRVQRSVVVTGMLLLLEKIRISISSSK